jgi:7SK snRNA methylphosphate capping enzyme
MEKGLKSHHFGHKKKFHSPIGGKRPHKTAILPKFSVDLKEPDKLGMKTKHGSRVSKLKFQMGGDSTDPLNLNSLIDRDPSEVTPQCSPLVDRVKDLSPQVAIARDVTDPLNLKCHLYQDLGGIVLPAKKKRKRKRNDSGCFDDEQENKTKKESNLNNEDAVLPKIKKKKHGKDGKEVKVKEKKKNSKEKNVDEEEELVNNDGHTIEKTSQSEETQAVASTKGSTDEPKTSIADEKVSLEVIEKCNEDVPKPTPSFVPEELPKPKSETKNVQKPSQPAGKRKPQKTFVYGNYNRYYGYRNPKVPNDPRLKLFHHKWFQDKTVLDIGCNMGNVTLEVARDFSPKHVLGIDIDSSLIRAANKYLRCTIQEHLSKMPPTQSSDFPMSFMMCHGPIVSRTSPTEGRTGYPYNVQFKEVSA